MANRDCRDTFKRRFFAYQIEASTYYHATITQVCVAFLIGINFLTNILEKEIDPDGTEYKEIFGNIENLFNVLFLIELLVNMYGHWFHEFWKDGWNCFDFTVVSIGVIMMLELPLPKSFNLLRTMRAFRVFRLFNRVQSLKKIIMAVMLSIPGVTNAFLILTIVMCIYAILGVEFFREVGDGCLDGNSTSDLVANRGRCIGREYFGTFSKSLYTFFQVMTGDSWSEAIGRPVIWSSGSPTITLGTALYFVSFVLVTAMVLVNVVVAVLLDKMVDPEVDVEEDNMAGGDGDDLEATSPSGGSPVGGWSQRSRTDMSMGTSPSAPSGEYIDTAVIGDTRQSPLPKSFTSPSGLDCHRADNDAEHHHAEHEHHGYKRHRRGSSDANAHHGSMHQRVAEMERELGDLRRYAIENHADNRFIKEQLKLIIGALRGEDENPGLATAPEIGDTTL